MNNYQIFGVVFTLLGLILTTIGTIKSSRRVNGLEKRLEPNNRESELFLHQIKKYADQIENGKFESNMMGDILNSFQTVDLKIEHYEPIKRFYRKLYKKRDEYIIAPPYFYKISCIVIFTYSNRIDKEFFKLLIDNQLSKIINCNGEAESKEMALRVILEHFYEKNFFMGENPFGNIKLFFKNLVKNEDLTKIVYDQIETEEERFYIFENYLKPESLYNKEDNKLWIKLLKRDYGAKVLK